MTISQQLIFLFSSLGAVNGFALSAYLIVSQPRSQKQIVLAFLILAISVRVTKSVFLYFNPDLARPFLQVGLTACFFIGPLCLAYSVAGKEQLKRIAGTWHVHCLILGALAASWILFFPFEPHGAQWRQSVRAIYYVWLCYMVLASAALLYPVIHDSRKRLRDRISPLDASVVAGCWILWASYFFSLYTSYLAGALSFTFIMYVTVTLLVLRGQARTDEGSKPYEGNKIPAEEADRIYTDLEALMSVDRIFEDANLTLPRVAKRLGISPQKLSQVLNDNKRVSFTHYLNGYRIERAKALLCEDRPLTMESVMELCGYNTQSTFYKAFKALTQTTPARYRAANRLVRSAPPV